jgi:hypothetical protein
MTAPLFFCNIPFLGVASTKKTPLFQGRRWVNVRAGKARLFPYPVRSSRIFRREHVEREMLHHFIKPQIIAVNVIASAHSDGDEVFPLDVGF